MSAGSVASRAIRQHGEWLAAAVVLAAAVPLSHAAPLETLLGAGVALAAVAVWIVWQDVKTLTISDAALLALAGMAVAIRWNEAASVGEPVSSFLATIAVDALLPGGLLLLFREVYYRRRGVDGLGFGDVKLAAAGGLLVGTGAFAWALFAASALALACVAACRLLLPGATLALADRLAFGAFLAPATIAVWLVQQLPPLLAAAAT